MENKEPREMIDVGEAEWLLRTAEKLARTNAALITQITEYQELLEDWHTAIATGEAHISDKAYRIVTRTAYALSKHPFY